MSARAPWRVGESPVAEKGAGDRCPSRVYYRGKCVARCFYRVSFPHDRHHNGTRSWRDGGKGVRNG